MASTCREDIHPTAKKSMSANESNIQKEAHLNVTSEIYIYIYIYLCVCGL